MSASEIQSIIARLNDAWINNRFDELHNYFDENVVLAHPGFEKRTVGRDALVASYADFARVATVHHVNMGEAHADVTGDTAITTTPWEMRYTYDGQTLEERGWDLLVFARRNSEWRVIWRTVIMNTTAPV